MSPDNQRDWSGLLYLPGEELVRSTIDGDDADWSESLSYVPPDSLVRSVLDASVRERPTFALPAALMPNRGPLGALSRKQRTAAILAGLGLSPFSLAAAAALHVAFLFVVGPWIATQATAARSIPPLLRPAPAIVATRVVYVLPANRSSPPIRPARKGPPRAITLPSAADTSNTSTAPPRTVSPLQLDSARTASQPAPGSSAQREIAMALDQELFFAGEGTDLEPRDMQKLELIVRVLTRWPSIRLRVLGAAPPLRPRERAALPGMLEAELVKRALVRAGIDSARIEVGQVPEAERFCPEREPNCAAGRRRVRTMVRSAP
jgi:outer membrane protein OmpA-like peptidoglycan-associated protein